MGLDELLNFIKTGKGKADALDLFILCTLLAGGVPAEGDAEVVRNGGEALVSQLDHAVREGENSFSLDLLVHLRGRIVEGGRLDHRALLVHEVEVEELT